MPPPTLSRLSRTMFSARTTTIRIAPRSLIQQRLRPLSTTTALSRPDSKPNPQREAQEDREKMDPSANETSKSGTDDTAAQQDQAAFDPDITDPQHAKDKAGEDNQVNPLDASPANPDISQTTAEEEGGSKKKQSEGGGNRK